MENNITITTVVHSPLRTVWHFWNSPDHIIGWMHASDDWECSLSVNNVEVGGRFSHTLRAKDGSISFDVSGIYTEVVPNSILRYTLDDGRTVSTIFEEDDSEVLITETFEPEKENPPEMQRDGWQAILNNFKEYTEERTMDYDQDTE